MFANCCRPTKHAIIILMRSLLLALVFLFMVAPGVQAATYSVTITSSQFVPATLTITTGDTVSFLNATSTVQTAQSSVASGFNTGDIAAGQSKSVVVNTAGTYTYSSAYNSALSGTITVTASSSATASTSATVTPTPVASTTSTRSAQLKGGDQPVSGTVEVLIALLASGAALIAWGGWQWNSDRRLSITLTDVPMVGSPHDSANDSESP